MLGRDQALLLVDAGARGQVDPKERGNGEYKAYLREVFRYLLDKSSERF
jgi:hypothetical protein